VLQQPQSRVNFVGGDMEIDMKGPIIRDQVRGLTPKNVILSLHPEFVPLPLHAVFQLQEGVRHFASFYKIRR
jgi:hypothetical protein